MAMAIPIRAPTKGSLVGVPTRTAERVAAQRKSAVSSPSRPTANAAIRTRDHGRSPLAST
jgi:hypothetical protein